MKKSIVILLLSVSTIINAQEISGFFDKANLFFNENVIEGKVAYSAIFKNPTELNELLLMAKQITVSDEDPEIYKSFWINSYNLFVIKGVIDNYPMKSPLDKAGFFDKIVYSIGGKKTTLNGIENKLLRAKFKDARFHFVLVCGAIGCPPLINKAYMPNTLEKQLDEQTAIALNGNFVIINDKKKKIEASEILNWYKEDFISKGENEIDYINKFRTIKIPNDYKVTYFAYNWSLNIQE